MNLTLMTGRIGAISNSAFMFPTRRGSCRWLKLDNPVGLIISHRYAKKARNIDTARPKVLKAPAVRAEPLLSIPVVFEV